MGKTLKWIVSILILFCCIAVLSACRSNGENKTVDNNNQLGNNASSALANNQEQKLDFKDSNIYFFSVNGEKYTIENQLKDLEKSGLIQDNTAAKFEIQKGSYSISNGFFREAATGKTIFSVIPVNNTDETIKSEDATIAGFFLENYYYKDFNGKIEVYGGITIGSTLDQLVGVFGEPTEKDMRANYENLGIVYKYRAGLFQYFEFEIDKKTNQIIAISWRYAK